ncbi:MAG: DUF2281 domain-containing protein [Chloroflexi bacterium]|nr:DUF2281 domain-containing protein [Chloroflexota bacterium]
MLPDLESRIQQSIQQLPEPLLEELLDFVQFLLLKAEQQEMRAWNTWSLTMAMRGMEDEPELYSLEDIKVPFS